MDLLDNRLDPPHTSMVDDLGDAWSSPIPVDGEDDEEMQFPW